MSGGGTGKTGLVELMKGLAAMAGAPFEAAPFPVPDHIAGGCPDAQTFLTPWGPVIVCGEDRLWFQNDAGDWVESRGRELPEEFRPSIERLESPTPPPDPPPPDPPPTPISPLWIAVGVVGLAALASLIGWIVLRDDPKDPERESSLIESPATSTTSAPETSTSTTSEPVTEPVTSDSASFDTAIAAPIGAGDLPSDAAREAETGLGLPPGALDDLVLMPATLPWESVGTRPDEDGAGIVSYGALRVGTEDVFLIMFDRPIADPGIEGAGTQLGVGRGPTVNEPSGLAGFGEGYAERFFLGSDGDLTVLGDDGEELTGMDARTYLHSMMGLFTLPSDDTIVRIGNFYRETEGAEATPDDPTAYQLTPPFRVTDEGIEPL